MARSREDSLCLIEALIVPIVKAVVTKKDVSLNKRKSNSNADSTEAVYGSIKKDDSSMSLTEKTQKLVITDYSEYLKNMNSRIQSKAKKQD